MCFFFYVSRHFFSPNLRGRAKNKQTKCPKKKHWLSVRDYLTDKWHTKLIVLSAVILLFIFYHTMIKLNSFQSPRKLDFSWYLTSLRRQRTCSNLQPKRSSTLRMHSSCRDRPSDGKLDRGLDSRPNTYPDVFVKARPHYYQQSLRSMISTRERILAFGFQWLDSVTRFLPPNSHKRALRSFQCFGKYAWMASIMLLEYCFETLALSSTSIQLRIRRKLFFLIAIIVKKLRRPLNRVCKCNEQVLRAWHRRSTALILWSSVFFFFFFFFFFGFQPKATRAGDEKHRKKKSTWPYPSYFSSLYFLSFLLLFRLSPHI